MHEKRLLSGTGHCRPKGCFDSLDCTVRYDKEVVVEPEKTNVVPRGYCYWDVHEQVTVVAVPDSSGTSGCRDPIEYLAALTKSAWSNVRTRWRVAT